MKKQQLHKKSLNPLGLGGGSARKKSLSSLRKVPSWHRQMSANGGTLSRLVRTECANVADKNHRYFPRKIQNSKTNVTALYGARRNDDEDDDSTDGVQREHNMSKSQSDTSMGTTSSWAGLNAPWDDDQEMPAPNELWESNGFQKLQTTSSSLLTISLPLPTREITTAPIVVETQATVSTSNAIARNPSEMSLGDPLDVLTERRKATAVNHFSNQNMSNVGWGSASLSRVLTAPMEATPASIL